MGYLRYYGTVHSKLDFVFKNIKAIFGGQCTKFITGSAPIASEILEFMKVTTCAQFIEGYGQTETCAASFVTDFLDGVSGHVGGPFNISSFKLIDVPDMNYTS